MKVLGFTEDFTTCDRCGKVELKGTWAIENSNGDLFRLGSSCIHKKFEMEPSEVKVLIEKYKKVKKNNALITKYITPLEVEMNELLNSGKGIRENIISEFTRVIELRKRKYKIA